MKKAGWNLEDLDDDQDGYKEDCGTSTFWGYINGQNEGKVEAVFKDSGKAILKFGECYRKQGETWMYLHNEIGNEIMKEVAKTNEVKTVQFQYNKGDRLQLVEKNHGIIIINSLILNCSGE